MPEQKKGRFFPPTVPFSNASINATHYAYTWNAPRESICTEASQPPASIRLFNPADQTGENLPPVRASLFDIVGQQYCPDPRPKFIRRRLSALPHFINRYYVQTADNLLQTQGLKRANAYLINTVEKHVLPRIDAVNARYQLGVVPAPLFSFLDDFARLPRYGKRELKRLAHRLTDCLMGEFLNYYNHQLQETDDISFSVIYSYGRVGWLVSHLNMSAPGWGAYCNEELTDHDALRAMARIESPHWWLRRIKKLHDKWREHLMIAAGYVHKKASPYCSDPALKEWMAQKKANIKYLKKMELENVDTGERTSLIDKVAGSVANPANRRRELMSRMRGFEDIADDLGLVGDFYTLTAPSKYHANHNNGKRNDKWNKARPSDTQKYLCRVWARTRAAWKRAGIRAFGFRVVEPHHDETPHWHLLLFMRPEDIDQARDIFCMYARWEDSEELQSQEALNARFFVKPIDKEEGSATGYIAKYISKNIDGYGLDDEMDTDTGLPLKDTARRVNAWASRWRIRQFQQIGGAPVTVYRELRKLSDRDLWLHPEISPAHIAADAGHWDEYTLAQGGPLVARCDLRVRLNYEVIENGNAYGDDVEKINGVYSPITGHESLIFTRTATYKIVPKLAPIEGVAVDLQGVDVDLKGAPRRLGVLSITVPVDNRSAQGGGFGDTRTGDGDDKTPDFDSMSRQERREMLDRFREPIAKRPAAKKSDVESGVIMQEMVAELGDIPRQLLEFIRSLGLEPTVWEFDALLAGGVVNFGPGQAFKLRGNHLLAMDCLTAGNN